MVLRAGPGFRWKEDRTPEKGPGPGSAGCQALSSSAAPAPGPPPPPPATPAHNGPLSDCGPGPGPGPEPRAAGSGLGLRRGLARPGAGGGGSDAVLSGVGLHVDSLESSSSDEQRASPFLAPAAPAAPLALAARSCLRNLARRFWNQTCGHRGWSPGPQARVSPRPGRGCVRIIASLSSLALLHPPPLSSSLLHLPRPSFRSLGSSLWDLLARGPRLRFPRHPRPCLPNSLLREAPRVPASRVPRRCREA